MFPRFRTWAGSLAGRFGFGRNPLLRRTDRIQGWATLGLLFLMVVVGPGLALIIGRATMASTAAAGHREAAARHQVTAVVQSTKATSWVYGSQQESTVAWVDGGRRYTASVSTSGLQIGSATPIWVDSSDRVTTAPTTHRQAVGQGIVAATVVMSVTGLVVVVAYSLIRSVLDGRRFDDWAHEWAVTAPKWTGRR